MNKRLKLLGIFITASLCCYAQTKEFDPSLDPNVTTRDAGNLRRNGTVAICGIRDNWLLSTSNNVPVSQKSVALM